MNVTYNEAVASSYDAEYDVLRAASGDRDFYAGLAAETAGPVLELGCGTGRVLLPIARTGVECVGLDLSPAMLEVLRDKEPPANLTLVRASMTEFDLGAGRFRLIFSAFRPLQHLCTVEEQLKTLACVRRHLATGGLFAFDMFAPRLERIALAEETECEDVEVELGPLTLRRYATVWRNHVTQVSRVCFRHEYLRGEQKIGEEVSVIHMRWFYRYEVEHLLARAGFEVVALYGGFDKRPYDAKGEMIFVTRPA